MGHYDTQFEQHNEDTRLIITTKLRMRLSDAIENMDTDNLEKLVISAENWDTVVGFLELAVELNKQ